MRKKSLIFLMVLVAVAVFVGCDAKDKDSASAAASTTQKTSSSARKESVWPVKPINIVITSSAGGDGDYLTRLLSVPLEKELGQTLVITNLAGGNGSIGMDELMNTDPNGYTFFVNNTCALSANEANGLVDYDYTVSAPVGVFAKHSGEMIWVRSDSPYQTMEDLVDATKANPGKVKLGVSMGGSVYAAALMLQRAGAQFSLVDASDGSERIIALLGKQVDCCIAGYGIGKEYIESGDLRPLCTLMGSRSAALPDVPTAVEAGVPGLVVNNLFLLLAPKGTDVAIIEKFNDAILKVINENKDYAASVTKYSGQDAYALNVSDTVEVLNATRDQFMSISDLLRK
ncbi:MAG: tripartite tricarboxylate transporter substrate binding protein [Sphaerochaetaceae bacterium]|nr:tripartite tricarboxylate transporter substrate binding protein [Sphaerochaetaceae bacterium]